MVSVLLCRHIISTILLIIVNKKKHNKITYVPAAARISYSVVSASIPDVVAINRDTGTLRLQSSLAAVTSEMINVTVQAFDGLHRQHAYLTMHIVDQNRFAPTFTFTEGEYSRTLEETTDAGTTVLRVSAEDLDSTVLAFTIVSGNTGNAFSLKPLSGTVGFGDLLLPIRQYSHRV